MILLSQYNKCTLCTCVRGVIHFFVKDQNQHQGEKERDQHTHEQHDHNRPAHQGEKRGEKERKTSTPTTNTTTKNQHTRERREEKRRERPAHQLPTRPQRPLHQVRGEESNATTEINTPKTIPENVVHLLFFLKFFFLIYTTLPFGRSTFFTSFNRDAAVLNSPESIRPVIKMLEILKQEVM